MPYQIYLRRIQGFLVKWGAFQDKYPEVWKAYLRKVNPQGGYRHK